MSGQGLLAYVITILLAALVMWALITYTDVGNHLDDDWPRTRALDKR